MLDIDGLEAIASTAFKSDIAEDLGKFLFAWFIVRKTIAAHLQKIEASLANINTTVGGLTKAMRDVESSHNNRLVALESEVIILKKKGG